ncbi:MAG: hypothetical protein GC168_17705 [Candidatus Hydrogenedens sp.]|nr:hypothetical protein [Candidatus Hydrogenedens sp.]
MFRFAGAVAALLLSIALSYGIVRYAVRDFSVVGGPGVETLEMAREVRGLSNALAFWANDFFSRFPPEGGAVDPDARRWAGQVLAPQYDELREQAVTADFPHPVWRDLVAAVYRCGYVLREPANEAARKQTAVEVRTAIAQAESWILEEKLDRYLPAAQQPFRF